VGDIIIKDRIYVPTYLADEGAVRKRYTHRFYDDSACRRCENRSEKHNSICEKCPAYEGVNFTAKRRIVGDVEYFGLPSGDRKNLQLVGVNLKQHSIQDKRCRSAFDYPVRMLNTFKPRDYQVPAIEALRKAGWGVLKAPPRSGKTPTLLYAGVAVFKYRIVILADQREFLQQFLNHVTEYTNLPKLEKKHNKKLYGFGKKPEHFEEYQIIACTYQSLATDKGKKLLRLLNKNFGTVFIDEVHSAAAKVFSSVINSISCRVRIGCTGTDERKKTGYYDIVKQVVGDVTAEISVDQLRAKVYVHPMDFVKSKSAYRGKAGFSYLVNFLSKHKKRNAFILEWIMKDLEKGHSIIIPLYRKEHVMELVKTINDEFGKRIAAPFMGGSSKLDKFSRDQTLEDAISGKIRVVVGIRSLLQRGLNVERWSMLYNVMPINNAPNWKQESSRILTPFDDKRPPAIRFFVDEHMKLCLGCFVSTYKQTVKLKHEPTDTAHERALVLFRKHGSKDGDDNDDAVESSRKYVRPFG
jgi:hypothetical protein